MDISLFATDLVGRDVGQVLTEPVLTLPMVMDSAPCSMPLCLVTAAVGSVPRKDATLVLGAGLSDSVSGVAE